MSAAGPIEHRIRRFGDYGLFVGSFLWAAVRHPPGWAAVIREAYNIGIKSLFILVVISGFVGTNLALQGYNAFLPLGGQRLVGMFVSLAGVRELAPIITAAMVAAKAGTEMASQIGVMRIREQIDALEVMAINAKAHLIAPRLLGILLVLPSLTVIAIFTLVASAWAVAVFQLGLDSTTFLDLAAKGVRPVDFLYGEIKAVFFGLIICTVSCWYGFTCRGGPEGVGQATNRAVVTSAVVCVLANYCLSEVMYGGSLP